MLHVQAEYQSVLTFDFYLIIWTWFSCLVENTLEVQLNTVYHAVVYVVSQTDLLIDPFVLLTAQFTFQFYTSWSLSHVTD